MPLTADVRPDARGRGAAVQRLRCAWTTPADRADILIVDDLPEKLLVFETVLGDLNQNLVFARSGADALRQILRRDFAVILLDVNMPDMDGFETATLIRRYKRAAHTPIIFITSYADEMQTARGYSLGAVDYIPSPVVPEVLRSKVRVFVELHILQRRIARQAEERVALAASEAALRLAEESTRRSSLLAGLSHALSGVLDLREGMHALLAHVVPALAANATVALVDERGVVTHAATRSSLFEDDAASVDLAPVGPAQRALRVAARGDWRRRREARAHRAAAGRRRAADAAAGARRPLPRRRCGSTAS